MRIVPEDLFTSYIGHAYNASILKFVSIGEFFYAVDYIGLLMSDEYKALGTAPLYFSQELLDSFPPPRQPLSGFPAALVKTDPVVMFESTVDKGRYWRFDRPASNYEGKSAWFRMFRCSMGAVDIVAPLHLR